MLSIRPFAFIAAEGFDGAFRFMPRTIEFVIRVSGLTDVVIEAV